MKAIIIAAGSGKRMGKHAEGRPKSLTDVNGKTILQRQIEALRRNGISEIIVITGPSKEQFTDSQLTYIPDKNYEEHDILGSLMVAKNHINNDVLILYSDILFEDKIINDLVSSNGDIGIAVDFDWKKSYEGRTMHPKSEAENILLLDDKILEIRKGIDTENGTVGEFLGIIRLSAKGADKWIQRYENAERLYSNKFHHAPSLKKAYLTDMIQELIDSGIDVRPIPISGKWCEIDTIQDLERAKSIFKN